MITAEKAHEYSIAEMQKYFSKEELELLADIESIIENKIWFDGSDGLTKVEIPHPDIYVKRYLELLGYAVTTFRSPGCSRHQQDDTAKAWIEW